MDVKSITKGKAYYHSVVMKTAYLYLPVLALIILISSFFEKIRFILYFTAVGASYGFILNQLKKKNINIEFTSQSILLGTHTINVQDIQSYYLSLPLNELLMLRIKTIDNDIAVYIDKDLKTTVESFFIKNSIVSIKENYDNYLKYGHLILPLAGIGICAVIYSFYSYFEYKL
ncbi:hypothetical protein M2347_002516 [Chryseobacterium sp. H1D6B]|uniref:hypothetical protein n=1 Tax=Chryseobacterium sp. H1D6B TaxID=2940588 RepID=UPI0015CD8E2C|nr:hypothetical protein [Chryseobacterium sp. H1D6B]MDH6252789.1 hypothetical protein [Chryseobacterium sp. H1D6B]